MEDIKTTDTIEASAIADPADPEAENAQTDASTTNDPGEPATSPSDPEQTEEAEERYEDIERDGRKARIPLWLKPELMMQADYTRKTQELAEARRTFEAERTSAQELGPPELSAYVNLQVIDRQIDQYSRTDWNASFEKDATAAQKAFFQFQLLKDARRETQNYLGHMRSERISRERQEADQRLEQCNVELANHLPDWSPATAAKLKQQGTQQFRFTADELDKIDDPRIVIALHAAIQWREHEAKQKRIQDLQKQQAVKPAEEISGATPSPAGLDDKLSAEEWLRRRYAQLPRPTYKYRAP